MATGGTTVAALGGTSRVVVTGGGSRVSGDGMLAPLYFNTLLVIKYARTWNCIFFCPW